MHLLPDHIRGKYEVHEWRHAAAVLRGDFPDQWEDIIAVLSAFTLRRSDVVAPGGGKSPVAVWFDSQFGARGWRKKRFSTQIVVDGVATDSPTHEVDCYKAGVALEIE